MCEKERFNWKTCETSGYSNEGWANILDTVSEYAESADEAHAAAIGAQAIRQEGPFGLGEDLQREAAVGAIYDFAAFLTTRNEQVVASKSDNAAPIADAVREFLKMRGISDDVVPDSDWAKTPA